MRKMQNLELGTFTVLPFYSGQRNGVPVKRGWCIYDATLDRIVGDFDTKQDAIKLVKKLLKSQVSK